MMWFGKENVLVPCMFAINTAHIKTKKIVLWY
jgi:hypothetical protein